MPNLSLKADNNREKVKFNIYSLDFKNYHEKIAEIEGAGTIELEEGSYKVEALDGKRSYQKVILLRGNLSTVIDFSDRFEEVKDKYAGLKGALVGAGIVLVMGVIFYLLGGLELII